MGLHADMEAQQVCEQLYQLIIVLVSVRDHTGPMRGRTSRAWPRGVRARTLQHALPGRRTRECEHAQQTWFRQEAGCADKFPLLMYLSLCVCARVCARVRAGCACAGLRQTRRLLVLWRATP